MNLSTGLNEPNNRSFLRNLFFVNYVILTCSAQLEFFPLDDDSSISNNYNLLSDEVEVECFSTVYLYSSIFADANLSDKYQFCNR